MNGLGTITAVFRAARCFDRQQGANLDLVRGVVPAMDGCRLVNEIEKRGLKQFSDRFPAWIIVLHDALFTCVMGCAAQVYYEAVGRLLGDFVSAGAIISSSTSSTSQAGIT